VLGQKEVDWGTASRLVEMVNHSTRGNVASTPRRTLPTTSAELSITQRINDENNIDDEFRVPLPSEQQLFSRL